MFPLSQPSLRAKGENSGYGLSPGLWGECELLKHGDDRNAWRAFFSDFRQGAGAALATNHALFGPWDAYGTTGVTVQAVTNDLRSAVRMSLDADLEEGYLAFGAYGTPIARFNPDSDGDLFFEAAVRFSNVADTTGAAKMVGLVEHGVPVTGMIAAGGASISTRKFAGYRALIADGDGMDAAYHNGTAETVALEAAATAPGSYLNIAATTIVKLGMRWRSRFAKLDFYVNGRLIKADVDTSAAAFPNTAMMVPFVGARQVGAGAHAIDTFWVAAAQKVEP